MTIMGCFELNLFNGDTIIIKNRNTTIGYACFNASAKTLDYIFVNPSYRRQGVGSKLLAAAENVSEGILKPAEPLSPLGKKFFKLNSHE